jgi:hypothetical protein
VINGTNCDRWSVGRSSKSTSLLYHAVASAEAGLFFITFIRKVMKIKNKTSCKIPLILSKKIEKHRNA